MIELKKLTWVAILAGILKLTQRKQKTSIRILIYVRQELQVALTQELTGSMIGQPKTDSS